MATISTTKTGYLKVETSYFELYRMLEVELKRCVE